MVASILPIKKITKVVSILLTAFFVSFIGVSETSAKIVSEKNGNLGVIKGIVRDSLGSPIADATVAIFRVGTDKLLKQVRSDSDGSFLAKIIPGTYTVLAVAQGFNPITLSEVEVNRSAELVYGFKLERSGSGNTLPEKRIDRNSSKSRIRAAQLNRSIYQNKEGDSPIIEDKSDETATEEIIEDDGEDAKRSGQTVVETYFAGSDNGNFTGVNFATLQSLGENAEIIFAGQIGTNKSPPNRFEAKLKLRPSDNHQIRFNASISKLGEIKSEKAEKTLGQVSFQTLDEWKVRSGVILVFGFDYSTFIGAGNDFSISPRLGLQFDANSKTRFRTSYTTKTEEQNWQRAVELEDAQILFQEPIAIQDFVVEKGKPQLNKNTRLEFGVERILDKKSNVEANVFFDTTINRGIGLVNIPLNPLNSNAFKEFVANQNGSAQGIRVVYTRRINRTFSTSAGYAFGNGQKLSEKAISNPQSVLSNDLFNTFIGQLDADFKTGTQVKTIFRLSPQAAVFAIDPFQGRLAIYDPGLSVLVTQSLPNWGLPIRAEAMVDARNLFDFQTNVNSEEGSLKLNSQGRTLRGGILVRF